MPKTILQYKCQNKEYLLTCLWCQIPFSKLLYLPLMPKIKLKGKCLTQYDLYAYLWCQRPNWCTNTYPRTTLNLSVVSKTILKYKYQIQENPTTCLWCQNHIRIPKKSHTHEYLNFPVMSKTILNYKSQNQEQLRTSIPAFVAKYQIEMQMPYPRWLLPLFVMPKTILQYKCQN